MRWGFYGQNFAERSDLAKGTENFIKNLKIKKKFFKKVLDSPKEL